LIGDQIEIDFCHTNLDGMPHVSLVSDIIQFLGPGGVPAIVAASVLGVFELGERFASQRAKDALSKWLLTFDVQKARALPEGTQELFERIFGERHFSWKCFIRSAAFSLGAMVFISILIFLIYPKEFSRQIRSLNLVILAFPKAAFPDDLPKYFFEYFIGVFVVSWFLWSIFIDYVSAAALVPFLGFSGWSEYYNMSILVPRWLDDMVSDLRWLIPPRSIKLDSGFFWAGFAPSIWMWLYVLALFVTRGLLRSERIVNWLRWGLDVEKNPFRSIGAVAAALAFIVSVAIILVSVEVSRISAAT
jgi:hypothetical protein